MAIGAGWVGRTTGRSGLDWDFTAQDRREIHSLGGLVRGLKILDHISLLPIFTVREAVRGLSVLDGLADRHENFFSELFNH